MVRSRAARAGRRCADWRLASGRAQGRTGLAQAGRLDTFASDRGTSGRCIDRAPRPQCVEPRRWPYSPTLSWSCLRPGELMRVGRRPYAFPELAAYARIALDSRPRCFAQSSCLSRQLILSRSHSTEPVDGLRPFLRSTYFSSRLGRSQFMASSSRTLTDKATTTFRSFSSFSRARHGRGRAHRDADQPPL